MNTKCTKAYFLSSQCALKLSSFKVDLYFIRLHHKYHIFIFQMICRTFDRCSNVITCVYDGGKENDAELNSREFRPLVLSAVPTNGAPAGRPLVTKNMCVQ